MRCSDTIVVCPYLASVKWVCANGFYKLPLKSQQCNSVAGIICLARERWEQMLEQAEGREKPRFPQPAPGQTDKLEELFPSTASSVGGK